MDIYCTVHAIIIIIFSIFWLLNSVWLHLMNECDFKVRNKLVSLFDLI